MNKCNLDKIRSKEDNKDLIKYNLSFDIMQHNFICIFYYILNSLYM
jgi:hypothetical protein